MVSDTPQQNHFDRIDYPVRVNYFDQINQATLLQDEREINRIRKVYALFSMLKPELHHNLKDNTWSVDYGTGSSYIVGVGNTPEQAIIDWNKNWR